MIAPVAELRRAPITAFLRGLPQQLPSIAVSQSGRQDVLRVASKSWQEEDARSRWLMTMCFRELIIDGDGNVAPERVAHPGAGHDHVFNPP